MVSRMIQRLFGRYQQPRQSLSREHIQEAVETAMSVRRRMNGASYLPGAAERVMASVDLSSAKPAVVTAISNALWREEAKAEQASAGDLDDYTRYTGYERLRIIVE